MWAIVVSLAGSSGCSKIPKPMKSTALDVRSWNGHAIQRRCADGYVNATAMCQAAGRRWHHYAANLRSAEYIKALEGSAGIPADLLAQTVLTGPNDRRGTWVHPRLAVDLARWISPEFAVWMDGWILEELEGNAKPKQLQLSLNNSDAADVIDMACDDIKQAAERLGAMVAGVHSMGAIEIANESLQRLQRRLAMVERLLPTITPAKPNRTSSCALLTSKSAT